MKATLSKIFKGIAQFFQDETGAFSAMRLLLILWGVGTLVVWLIVSLKTAGLANIPWSVTSFVTSLVFGKIVQNFTENGMGTPQTPIPPPTVTTTTTTTVNPPVPPVTPPVETPVTGSNPPSTDGAITMP